MQTKCEYCGSFYDDTLEKCPNCGATNNNIRRISQGVPTTIEELKQYCADHNVPLVPMRFHIGEDYKGAKAYGIYRDGDKVIVYKNKADGTRAVRYSGTDEAYAVNEIYQKLRTEYNGHKEANASRPPQHAQPQRNHGSNKRRRRGGLSSTWIAVLVVVALIILIAICSDDGSGYYRYEDNYYYKRPNGSWYLYNTLVDDWEPSAVPTDDMSDYWSGSSYDSSYGIENFSDSEYYDPSDYETSSSYDDDDSSWSSSWDDDDDWDSGSDWDWDSGSDWDSDW
ncbi:MAG: anaerobic ribonucleoside-triphosphate reductase [Lachnospiraceae bacterium]|nr:anaerobic ribonucleoside-triphosphate reductase [Lachnospiraceae bacterium]